MFSDFFFQISGLKGNYLLFHERSDTKKNANYHEIYDKSQVSKIAPELYQGT